MMMDFIPIKLNKSIVESICFRIAGFALQNLQDSFGKQFPLQILQQQIVFESINGKDTIIVLYFRVGG
jgi:hypothetical protein